MIERLRIFGQTSPHKELIGGTDELLDPSWWPRFCLRTISKPRLQNLGVV